MSYTVFYIIKHTNTNKYAKNSIDYIKNNEKRIVNINIKTMVIVFFVCTTICVYFLLTYGIKNILFRATASAIYENQIQYLIKGTLYPTIMSFSVIFAIMFYRQKKNILRFLLLAYLIAIFFITFSPLALPRFRTAALYGAILIYFFKSFDKKNIFLYCFFIGMVLLFPIMSFFRNEEVIKNPALILKCIPNIRDDFVGGDYDSYSTLPLVIEYVKQEGITWGRQLLGVILFFLPRSIWNNKPIGSGATVAEMMNKDFTNVSCQYVSEGYINFGVFGLIIFIIILSKLITEIDKYILEIKKNNKSNDIILLGYNYLIFLLFFILRGDLLSSFSFTIGTLSVIIVMSYICNKLNKNIKASVKT
jgi:hypothetical protein